jgi:hypothetical protein
MRLRQAFGFLLGTIGWMLAGFGCAAFGPELGCSSPAEGIQVRTLNWKPEWQWKDVDMGPDGNFYFSPEVGDESFDKKQAVKGDVDGSGRVDIVDAMILARHLKAGDATEAAWDANGDAKVDQRDVDAVAAAAVSLKQTGVALRGLPTMDDLGLARVPKAIEPAPRDVAALDVRREAGQ